MKKLVMTICLVVSLMMLTEVAYGQSQAEATNQSDVDVGVIVQGPGYSEGGDSDATSIAVSEGGEGGQGGAGGQSSAGAGASADNTINTTSISNYEVKTPPLPVPAPYLPFAQHGGWGVIETFFQNGPNGDLAAYAQKFNPSDKQQMKELRNISNKGLIEGLISLFGDNKIKITESLVKTPRKEGKVLRTIPGVIGAREKLQEAGYISVGKIGCRGTLDHNWDHVYLASVEEALKWDIDIILVDGGMKGVTIMKNGTFPGIAGAYGQANYSISALGVTADGITEASGRPVLSAEAYRYDPITLEKRRVSREFYNRIGLEPGNLYRPVNRSLVPMSPIEEQEKKAIESQIAPISSDPGIIEGIEIKIGPVGVSKDPEIIEMLDARKGV